MATQTKHFPGVGRHVGHDVVYDIVVDHGIGRLKRFH
jgi:hypothetical protein